MLKSSTKERLRTSAAAPSALVGIALACSLGAGAAWADEAVLDEDEEFAVEAAVEEADEETVEGEEEEETTWAYAGITLDSEDYGVGVMYYASGYFSGEGLVNPATTELYIEEEPAGIEEAAADEEGYTAASDAAALGFVAYGTGEIYWYDADAVEEIVSHSDALYLDTVTGIPTDESGEVVAEAMEQV